MRIFHSRTGSMMTAAMKKSSRTTRKRERTRDSLLKAMQVVVMEKGYEKTNINDVTESADVGLGTFYNYFESKAEIMAGVVDLMLRYYHITVDEVTGSLEDSAERFAASIRYTLQTLTDNEGFGRLIVECSVPFELYAGNIRERAEADMQAGIDDGRFHVNDLQITLNMIAGSILYSGADLYFGKMPQGAISRIIESLLVLVGIDQNEAQAISLKEFPMPKPLQLPLSLLELEAYLLEKAESATPTTGDIAY